MRCLTVLLFLLVSVASLSPYRLAHAPRKSKLLFAAPAKRARSRSSSSSSSSIPSATKSNANKPIKQQRENNNNNNNNNNKSSSSSSSLASASLSKHKHVLEEESVFLVDEAFRSQVRDFRKNNAPKKLLAEVELYANENRLDQNMSVFAFRTLQRMNRSDLCVEVVPFWHKAVDLQQRQQQQLLVGGGAAAAQTGGGGGGGVDIVSATAMLRSCCKLLRVDLAESIAARAGATVSTTTQMPQQQQRAMAACVAMLPELALGYANSGSFGKALQVLDHLVLLVLEKEDDAQQQQQQQQQQQNIVGLDVSKQILKVFLKEAPNGNTDVRRALRALLRMGGLTDNDSLQLLTSSYMKNITFVKGAVSMETLPALDLDQQQHHDDDSSSSSSSSRMIVEAAFIGRSNVGKSSLINMISNRKGLAFTSKTPGKTSEFNYFDAQGRIGSGGGGQAGGFKGGEKHRFYLVDLPGVGYAEVARELKASWLALLNEYVSKRASLRVLFHLIDSRHGMLDADQQCLSLLSSLPSHVQYVIVLTKADKRGGGVRRDVLDRINKETSAKTSRFVPILLTSSETREGGTELWSVLLDALAGEASTGFRPEKQIDED